MADENKRNDNMPEITSLSDEETITEIDLGEFLSVKDGGEVIYDGFHDDIKKTEQSLDNELKSLYDNIMNTDAVTAADLEKKKAASKEESGLEGMWMNPDEYIDMPVRPEPKPPVQSAPSGEPDAARDDIMGMIESLKQETENEKGFDEILSGIHANKDIELANTDLKETSGLTQGFVPAPELPDPPAVENTPAPAAQKPKAPYGIDTSSPEFENELAELLGDEEPEKPAEPVYVSAPKTKPEFTVNIPDEDTVPPIPVYGSSLISNERTVGVEPVEIIEDNGKISRKEKKQAKLEQKQAQKPASGGKGGDIIRRIVFTVAMLVIVVSAAYLVKTYIYEPFMYKKNETHLSNSLDVEVTGTVEEAVSGDSSKYPVGMLAKYKKLYDINSDLKGWISIPALEINLPIAQGKDNDYYLHRNIYKKTTNYGVPFFDYRIKDFVHLHKNTVVYGHNMHYDDLIFGLLENYREIDGFKSAPTIECNTIYGNFTWKIYAVFITNSKASQDNGYLFPYNFVDISNEQFSEYIKEVDKRKFYTTGVDIYPTDKILTLSTCCYDFDEARLVVVARLLRDSESPTVDTTLAVKNENPRYPQAWYNANKKTNPYADASNWNPY